jgi:hypothetical protein
MSRFNSVISSPCSNCRPSGCEPSLMRDSTSCACRACGFNPDATASSRPSRKSISATTSVVVPMSTAAPNSARVVSPGSETSATPPACTLVWARATSKVFVIHGFNSTATAWPSLKIFNSSSAPCSGSTWRSPCTVHWHASTQPSVRSACVSQSCGASRKYWRCAAGIFTRHLPQVPAPSHGVSMNTPALRAAASRVAPSTTETTLPPGWK